MSVVSSLFPFTYTELGLCKRMLASVSRLRVLFLFALLLLAACGARVELFSAANESEADEVLSVLLDAGIQAQKSTTKAGISIAVEGPQVARSLDILRAKGLPRERFDGMGQIFRKEGLVSSPVEERARYIYALSQELTSTLSQMDGVLVARVHVVLPERGGLGESATPSTAAVFIKHQAGYNLDALQPQIRKLVTHAIPSLTEDKVSIALVSAQPAGANAAQTNRFSQVFGLSVTNDSATSLRVLLGGLIVLVVMLAGGVAYLLWRFGLPWGGLTSSRVRREPSAKTDGTST